MDGTPRLYNTLVQVFSQHQNWVDLRISRPWLHGVASSRLATSV